jgi:hypothetical protein
MSLPLKLTWDMSQTRWATALDPVIKNQLIQGNLISNISLINGVTTINHLLGRKQIGYIITDVDAAAIIFRSQPLNDKTLTLTSNAAVNISIWCF